MKILLALLCSVALAGAAENVTLAWDASPEAVTNYVLHIGNVSSNYTQRISVGCVTEFTLTNLPPQRYFAMVTCQMNGMESDPSNECAFTVALAPVQNLRIKSRLQVSRDLKSWDDLAVLDILRTNTEEQFFRMVLGAEPITP
jgi:hypothetical protein